MRSHLLALSLLAVPASLWADEFSVPSRVTEATVFPQGAMLKRVATFDVPEGRHQIILTDMQAMCTNGNGGVNIVIHDQWHVCAFHRAHQFPTNANEALGPGLFIAQLNEGGTAGNRGHRGFHHRMVATQIGIKHEIKRQIKQLHRTLTRRFLA